MDESSGSKRGEAREFWEAAIRLWTDSGLSVREFCIREGLTEHTFYSWRRELRPESAAPEISQESPATGGGEVTSDGRRRRKPKRVAADNVPEATASFIELVAPTPAGLCHCTLELENVGGAKMRIQLKSSTMPDLAVLSQSFWNQRP